MQQNAEQLNKERRCVLVYGIVQGVGFRPFVDRIAAKSGVCGDVCNKGSFVEIHIEGEHEKLESFMRLLKETAPERSQILKITQKQEPCRGDGEFIILPSKKVEGNVFVSPDIAICEKCKKEMYDPHDRRYLHPFINCTACGPRLTILDSMPYDRVRTSMGAFPMCEACETEYTHPQTRRYHAQPVCCNDCGPRLYLLKSPGEGGKPVYRSEEEALSDPRPKTKTDRLALREARNVLRSGGILAVKGIGGFHLCCDAKNEETVRRLRELKQRPFKPFALMMKDMDAVIRECLLLDGQQKMLEGPQKPILLLRKKSKEEGAEVSSLAAPENPYIGVMLPYAPVQLLLFDDPDDPLQNMTDCLIMTSANPKGAPICRTDEDILNSVGKWCDAILSNNRIIRTRADDSVMNWLDGKPAMIRRSRGFAPLPLMLDEEDEENGESAAFLTAEAEQNTSESAGRTAEPGHPENSAVSGMAAASADLERTGDLCVLGIGGELKNTFCLAKGNLYYPSAYVGDLTDIRTVDALKETEERMERLLQIQPDLIVCDLHPAYRSSMTAEELAEKKQIPLLKIQHHYAHVLSCMAENQYLDPVIGVSLDGTGYGTDESIWGGEFLLADRTAFTRLGSIGTFQQAGGDLASRQGWRIAAALLKQADEGKFMERSRALGLGEKTELSILSQMIDKGINTARSTSMGRLFDAASAVLGFRREATCEGEASMVLQFAAERAAQKILEEQKAASSDPASAGGGSTAGIQLSRIEPLLDWRPEIREEKSEDKSIGAERTAETLFRIPVEELISELSERKLDGENPDRLALGFHQCIAELILAGCLKSREISRIQTAALSGGVLQNLLLSRLTIEKLKENHFKVLTHSMIPANDGGIAAGQALYGMQMLRRKK
ncbi:MAG: carbamoyltransferase HypF [Eubacterium sp.]|jgi:hydrogenase maturation protein HypF|nr:carbamoyltransferase HypF [Eubacterium sp.]MCH4046531.1 carbamoyltransferase HypF [Eubacterium sp.]MCH4079626.1 carbamoyltransferase HypF [Eubacterium sp.]MCH4110184.1 carbamoyltransferase HypF [Eubacterium sp.]MCI1307447.1 carbamoyltransferase HypF [Eubacterium sp.]